MEEHGISAGVNYGEDLTWREQEVLLLLGERLTNREIAERLHLAESTVKDYVGRILSKLYVKNRRQAVERAAALGLLDEQGREEKGPVVNLPAELTPFVGRVDELAAIKRHLAENRLLTLTGPGGIGKTRLAIKAAKAEAANFADGVFFVPLAPIASTGHLVQTVAEALNFPLATYEDPQHQLIRYLSKRRLLLVMDNFEHLLDGAGVVAEILGSASAVKILATSRERLNLQSETILDVAGMSFPDQAGEIDPQGYDAINLFVQSARKVHPDYEPPREEVVQIAEICQMVGGMPLAIELAAAWLQLLKVDGIAAELEKGLGILATETRDTPGRHRSISAVFDHSWSLLDPSEQDVFLILSVFRGGFTRDAAQRVAGASLQQLAGLVRKSLLNHDPDSDRLEVHELLRQYAYQRLAEKAEAYRSAHKAHATYYAEFMQARWVKLKSGGQMGALAEIEADIENVRSAWRYSLEQEDIPQLWMFIKALWFVYWIRWWNHAGMELFAEAVRVLRAIRDSESVALRALAMAFQGYFMAWLDLSDQGYPLTKESVQILADLQHAEALLMANHSLGLNAYMIGRYSELIETSERMTAIAAEIDEPWMSTFIFTAGMAAILQEDYAEARRLAELNLKINQEIGDLIGSAYPYIVLGHAALALEEYADARGYYLRCLAIAQEVGFPYAKQTSSKYLGKVDILMGDLREAEYYLQLSLKISKDIRFVRDIVNLLYEYARLRVAQGDADGAVELLALVIQHPASQLNRMMEGRIRDSARKLLAELERNLPQEAFNAAIRRGRELDLDAIVDELLGSRANGESKPT